MYLLNGLKGTSMNTAWTHNKTTLHYPRKSLLSIIIQQNPTKSLVSRKCAILDLAASLALKDAILNLQTKSKSKYIKRVHSVKIQYLRTS